MLEQTMGLQRIGDLVEREVRMLGVAAGIGFSDVICNMIAVIKGDPALSVQVRDGVSKGRCSEHCRRRSVDSNR